MAVSYPVRIHDLMTDEYPPFPLDLGGTESAEPEVAVDARPL